MGVSDCPTCGAAVHVYRDEAREALAEARLSREATEKAVARLVEVEAERDRLKWRATLEERRGDDAVEVVGFLEARAEAAEARLAAVEALCDDPDALFAIIGDGTDSDEVIALVRAAARGEGDRHAEPTPTDGRHPFVPPVPTWGIAAGAYPCGYYYGDSCDPLTVVYCRRAESDPIHSGEGDR